MGSILKTIADLLTTLGVKKNSVGNPLGLLFDTFPIASSIRFAKKLGFHEKMELGKKLRESGW